MNIRSIIIKLSKYTILNECHPNSFYHVSMACLCLHRININHEHPGVKPVNWIILLTHFMIFNSTQYMSMSHGYSTVGGIECGGRDQ